MASGEKCDTATSVAPPAPVDQKKSTKPRQPPLYNVILLDDNDHSYEYVIEMLKALFGHPPERGYRMAEEVDAKGRVIVLTTHKEHAELKRDQIHAYGADERVATCRGAMSTRIEPVE